MDNLPINQQSLLSKFNLKLDVTKSADVLGKDDVRFMDIFGDSKVTKQVSIFDQGEVPKDDEGFVG